MEARYRKLYPKFWRDQKVSQLTAEQKLIALYCLTGPQTNRIGFYTLSPGAGAEDLGMLPQTFRDGFERVCETLRWTFDKNSRVLLIPTWWKYNPPENENVLIGNLKDLSEVPETQIDVEFTKTVETLPQTLRVTFLKRLPIRYPKPSPNQEQYQEQ